MEYSAAPKVNAMLEKMVKVKDGEGDGSSAEEHTHARDSTKSIDIDLSKYEEKAQLYRCYYEPALYDVRNALMSHSLDESASYGFSNTLGFNVFPNSMKYAVSDEAVRRMHEPQRSGE